MAKGDNLNRLAYFVAVFETGSFTLAAERLNVTKSIVSRQITLLEREVGVALFIRSTRRVSPSEAGEIFYLRCSKILVLANKAFAEMSRIKDAQQ